MKRENRFVEPLVLKHELNANGIYEAHSSDGYAVFTMDPATKETVLSWRFDEPGADTLAAMSFIRGFQEYVAPIREKPEHEITISESVFLCDMTIAFERALKTIQPDGIIVH